MADKYLDSAMMFKALGDPKRIMILEMLSRGELCVCKILEKFDMAQSTLSHHMGLLSKSGFVIGRNEGKWTYYSLNPQGFKNAEQVIELLSQAKPKPSITKQEAKDGSI